MSDKTLYQQEVDEALELGVREGIVKPEDANRWDQDEKEAWFEMVMDFEREEAKDTTWIG